MLNIFVRTIIVYIALILFMKLMGKRQIGELQISELITTILLSELAAAPLNDLNVPLLHSAVPILTLLFLEIGVSFFITKSDILKRFFDGVPNIVIRRGTLDQKQLAKLRISMDELLSELRQQGISSIEEVAYAVLEQNGKLSVIKKAKYQGLTKGDAGANCTEQGFDHPLIIDGNIIKTGLGPAGFDMRRLSKLMRENNISAEDVFLLTADDSKKINIIMKEKGGAHRSARRRG